MCRIKIFSDRLGTRSVKTATTRGKVMCFIKTSKNDWIDLESIFHIWITKSVNGFFAEGELKHSGEEVCLSECFETEEQCEMHINSAFLGKGWIYKTPNQPERSKREDLVYIEPDFEKMKVENPCLYSKYEAAQEALRCGALNSMET